jgi:hypothetical protein
MRPTSAGSVEPRVRKVCGAASRFLIDAARCAGQRSVRPALEAWLDREGVPH